MSTTLRIFFALLTLTITLCVLGLAVWGFVKSFIGLGVVGVILAGFFGIFVYHDYQFFFGKKS